MKLLFQIVQGSLVGLGAVLPGISGGVLCVIFGIYSADFVCKCGGCTV